MTCEQIRWWLTELRRLGWGMKVLGRTMGLAKPSNIWRKANGKERIYPTEQVRMSRQIKRILSGELVCVPGKAGRVKGGGYQPGKAVLAAHPVPLVPPTKVLDVEHLLKRGVGRLKVVPAYEPPALKLPDFEALRKVLDRDISPCATAVTD
jgi:hypothetical protein